MAEIAWSTVEYYKYEKGGWWYAILWAVAVGFSLLAFFTDNYLVVGLIVIAAVVKTLYGAKVPQRLHIGLDDEAL